MLSRHARRSAPGCVRVWAGGVRCSFDSDAEHAGHGDAHGFDCPAPRASAGTEERCAGAGLLRKDACAERAGSSPASSAGATWDRDRQHQGRGRASRLPAPGAGARAAYDLIDNCYRTHSLGRALRRRVRDLHHAGLSRDQGFGRRSTAAAARPVEEIGAPLTGHAGRCHGPADHWGLPTATRCRSAYAEDLKVLVDRHGLPIFLAIVVSGGRQGRAGSAA